MLALKSLPMFRFLLKTMLFKFIFNIRIWLKSGKRDHIFVLVLINPALQALKSSKEVELVDDKIRCKTEPERWPIPTPPIVGSPRTDFSQLINCPEFVPRQTLNSTNSGQYSVSRSTASFCRRLMKIKVWWYVACSLRCFLPLGLHWIY